MLFSLTSEETLNHSFLFLSHSPLTFLSLFLKLFFTKSLFITPYSLTHSLSYFPFFLSLSLLSYHTHSHYLSLSHTLYRFHLLSLSLSPISFTHTLICSLSLSCSLNLSSLFHTLFLFHTFSIAFTFSLSLSPISFTHTLMFSLSLSHLFFTLSFSPLFYTLSLTFSLISLSYTHPVFLIFFLYPPLFRFSTLSVLSSPWTLLGFFLCLPTSLLFIYLSLIPLTPFFLLCPLLFSLSLSLSLSHTQVSPPHHLSTCSLAHPLNNLSSFLFFNLLFSSLSPLKDIYFCFFLFISKRMKSSSSSSSRSRAAMIFLLPRHYFSFIHSFIHCLSYSLPRKCIHFFYCFSDK